MQDELTTGLVRLLASFQVELFGVASMELYRRRFPEAACAVPHDLPRAVVAAYPLLSGVLESIDQSPNHLYFHHYRQVNFHLDRLALAVGLFLESAGYKALPVAASQTLDQEDRTAHLSHRHLGFAAGLGWRGKNNLLVNQQYGSRFRLVSILTDAPLVSGNPREDELCGACGLCGKACPAGAIGATAADFDPAKCAAKLAEFRKIPRIGQRICGICQRACTRFGQG